MTVPGTSGNRFSQSGFLTVISDVYNQSNRITELKNLDGAAGF